MLKRPVTFLAEEAMPGQAAGHAGWLDGWFIHSLWLCSTNPSNQSLVQVVIILGSVARV
jgi:hypothetical protein